MSVFPLAPGATRLSRLRGTAELRGLARETVVTAADCILPVFVAQHDEDTGPIDALPGVRRHSVEGAVEVVRRAAADGVGGVLLFGVPGWRDGEGASADAEGGAVVSALRAIKRSSPAIAVLADVCLCAYTDHGHCSVGGLAGPDMCRTLERHADVACAYARAGADAVAPSGMLDGVVSAIRAAFDADGFGATPIVSYAAKFASALYGPFREASGSSPAFGDRRGHQLDVANRREALRSALQDEAEGADALIVKPAGWALDVVADVRARAAVPVYGYQVSGEYAMIEAAGARGWLDARAAALEALVSIKRAGADRIITYYADRLAAWQRAAHGDAGS